WSELADVAEAFNCKLTQDGDLTKFFSGHGWRNNHVLDYIREVGLMGSGAHEKSIPSCIFTRKNELVALFLSRLFACDGWACVSSYGQSEIGYCSVNEVLIRQVQHLLLRFGVYSSITSKKTSYKRRDGSMFKGSAWQLTVLRRDDILRFAK